MSDLVKQPTNAPGRKVVLGAATAVVVAILTQVAATYPSLAFLAMPEIAAGVPVLLGYAVSYLARERRT